MEFFFDGFPAYTPMSRLADNLGQSMQLMSRIEQLHRSLPGIDCGACGAPNCRAFAEDVVRGQAQPHECVVAMRQTIQTYAEQMQLSQPCTPPPEEQPKKEDLP